jgi:hypothetical protein
MNQLVKSSQNLYFEALNKLVFYAEESNNPQILENEFFQVSQLLNKIN